MFIVSGVTETEQQDMFKILASILHLGNVEFYESNLDVSTGHVTEDGAYISVSFIHYVAVCVVLFKSFYLSLSSTDIVKGD
jgi:hypothetical protein